VSSGCTYEPTVIPTEDHIDAGRRAGCLSQGRARASGGPTVVDIHEGYDDITVNLPRMPSTALFRVVADVVHDRLFVISAAGLSPRSTTSPEGPTSRTTRST
jgi:hypothetical protein